MKELNKVDLEQVSGGGRVICGGCFLNRLFDEWGWY